MPLRKVVEVEWTSTIGLGIGAVLLLECGHKIERYGAKYADLCAMPYGWSKPSRTCRARCEECARRDKTT